VRVDGLWRAGGGHSCPLDDLGGQAPGTDPGAGVPVDEKRKPRWAVWSSPARAMVGRVPAGPVGATPGLLAQPPSGGYKDVLQVVEADGCRGALAPLAPRRDPWE
jgi:hypothetical protein